MQLSEARICGSSCSGCRLVYSTRCIETSTEVTNGGTMRICLRHHHDETRTHVDSRGALAIAQPLVGHALREFLESQNDTFLLERAPSLPLAIGPHPTADKHNFSL